MFKRGTCYSKACLFYVDVSLLIRKEVFYRKSLVLLVYSKDFEPK